MLLNWKTMRYRFIFNFHGRGSMHLKAINNGSETAFLEPVNYKGFLIDTGAQTTFVSRHCWLIRF